MERRAFVGAAVAAAGMLLCAGCSSQPTESGQAGSGTCAQSDAGVGLPPASPDPESPFGVDETVNMAVIDDYLNIPGVTYCDMRMVKDPADYEALGGSRNLDIMLPGFRSIGFPYIATLQELPVEGAYDGDHLFDVEWNADGTVKSATPCYEESEEIIADLFPRETPIVLMCGGAGYANMMRQLLLFWGYDPAKVYNAGGAWDYDGYESIQITDYDVNGDPRFYLWRADVVPLEFEMLSPI